MDLALAKKEAVKRTRSTVRTEASIIADRIIDALIPAVTAAIETTNAEMRGTDWIVAAVAEAVDSETLRKRALEEIQQQAALAAA